MDDEPSEMMRESPGSGCLFGIVTMLALLSILYGGAYWWCMEPVRVIILTHGMPDRIEAKYSHAWMSTFFAPLESLDRNVRPGIWKP